MDKKKQKTMLKEAHVFGRCSGARCDHTVTVTVHGAAQQNTSIITSHRISYPAFKTCLSLNKKVPCKWEEIIAFVLMQNSFYLVF